MTSACAPAGLTKLKMWRVHGAISDSAYSCGYYAPVAAACTGFIDYLHPASS